jgi:hypothetical protein
MFPEEAQYELLHKADLTKDDNTTRLLHRMVLPPTVATRDGLTAYTDKYCRLIECLANCMGENIDDLANIVLLGTSFNGPNTPADPIVPELIEAQLILVALQVAADRVDTEFQLLMQCRAVDYIRQQREAPYWLHLRETNEPPSDHAWQEVEDEMWWPPGFDS